MSKGQLVETSGGWREQGGAGAAPWGALCWSRVESPSLHGILRQPLSTCPLYDSENCVLGPRKRGPSCVFLGLPFPPLPTSMYYGSQGAYLGLGAVKPP